MNLSEASSYYEKLLAQASKKSEKKIYTKFKKILDSLQQRTFTAAELETIDAKLKSLQLKEGGLRASFHRKKFTVFTNFLKKEFALVTVGYYTTFGISIGMSLGMAMGVAIGTAFGATGTSMGLAVGMGIGMALGAAYGSTKDAQAKKDNLVLDL